MAAGRASQEHVSFIGAAAVAGSLPSGRRQRCRRRGEVRADRPIPSDHRADGMQKPENAFDPAKQQNTGAVLGIAMASYRDKDGDDRFFAVPGDDVKIAFFTVGQPPKIAKRQLHDRRFLRKQDERIRRQVRVRADPQVAGASRHDRSDDGRRPDQRHSDQAQAGRQRRRGARQAPRGASTRDCTASTPGATNKAPLLDAVHLETLMLNVLLFLIIAVAGFGILAIFYMIVVEKTRDIGILKSLGASGTGVMGIFLGYGLSLGLVGSGVGTVLRAAVRPQHQRHRQRAGWLTGKPVFDPSIYYFYKIPADRRARDGAWIVLGALCIAVAASILPAHRAARLHPVEALRYE